jgi:hypothetical protein
MYFFVLLGILLTLIAIAFLMLGLRIFFQNKEGIKRHCVNDKNKRCFCSDEQRAKCTE